MPAVLYGHHTEPEHLTLPGHEVLLALRTANVLIRLEGLPGGAQLALPKAVQRDPIKGWVEHVDLLLVRRGEKVTVDMPIASTARSRPTACSTSNWCRSPSRPRPPTSRRRRGQHRGHGSRRRRARWRPRAAGGGHPGGGADILVLHVLAAPTAEQMEAELGRPRARGRAEVPGGRGVAPPTGRGRGWNPARAQAPPSGPD